jgi:hypothetical protein
LRKHGLLQNPELRIIAQFRTVACHTSPATTRQISSTNITEDIGFVGNTEADSHADTFVAGKNCVTSCFTDRTCDVQPCSNDYAPMKDVPIVTAATGCALSTGMNCMLVFPEALSMPALDHSLFNPNQLRHCSTIVQDNPYCNEPMSVTSPSGDFTACLQSMGTEIFIKTWTPSAADLQEYPHVVLCSSAPWNPCQVQFPGIAPNEQEEIEVQNIQAVRQEQEQEQEQGNALTGEEDILFCIEAFWKSIASSARITFEDMEEKKEKHRIEAVTQVSLPPLVLPGPLEEHETLPPHTFLSKDRHSRTTPEDELNERWGLSIAQAALTLKGTTRRLVRSALMPLARRCQVDRVFEPNRLSGTFTTDTMDMRCNSTHGERCCQAFANKEFFAAAYPREEGRRT